MDEAREYTPTKTGRVLGLILATVALFALTSGIVASYNTGDPTFVLYHSIIALLIAMLLWQSRQVGALEQDLADAETELERSAPTKVP